jgi:hypothetical protein
VELIQQLASAGACVDSATNHVSQENENVFQREKKKKKKINF